jgi:hypothetical protein
MILIIIIDTLIGIKKGLNVMKKAVKLVDTAPNVRIIVGTQQTNPVNRLGIREISPKTPGLNG